LWNQDETEYADFLNVGRCIPNVDNGDLVKMEYHALHDATAIPFIRYDQTGDYSADRNRWYKTLENVIHSLVDEQGIAEECHELCVKNIVDFSQELIKDPMFEKSEEDIELSILFINYLVGKMSEKTEGYDLVGSIKQMLYREINPTAKLSDQSKYIARLAQIDINSKTPFWQEDNQYVINIYDKLFSAGYREVLVDRVSEDIYRMLSINLLRSILKDCVGFSLDFFRTGNIKDEEEETLTIIKELEQDKRYLIQALEYHTETVPVKDL